ncbi:MAG: hypothetical protein RLZZ627_1258 [Pseudomonadota bacterium]|jgi:hypothetical protein
MDNEIIQRLENVETIIRGLRMPEDRSAEIASLRKDLESVNQRVDTALGRHIPDTSSFITASDLHANLRAAIEPIVDEIVAGEKAVKREVSGRVDRAIGEVNDNVRTARNASLAFAHFASDMIKQRAMEMAR